MARDDMVAEEKLTFGELNQLKRFVKQLKSAKKTHRSLQLLFWYRKGERSRRLCRLIRTYLEGI